MKRDDVISKDRPDHEGSIHITKRTASRTDPFIVKNTVVGEYFLNNLGLNNDNFQIGLK